MFWIKLRILWMSLLNFCLYLFAFTIFCICLFWDLYYIDLFDSNVRILFFVHFFRLSSIEKGKSFEILCCAVPITWYIDLIFEQKKQWKLFLQAFNMHWCGWSLPNYLSGTREAICHDQITHVISQIWFAMNLVSNFS